MAPPSRSIDGSLALASCLSGGYKFASVLQYVGVVYYGIILQWCILYFQVLKWKNGSKMWKSFPFWCAVLLTELSVITSECDAIARHLNPYTSITPPSFHLKDKLSEVNTVRVFSSIWCRSNSSSWSEEELKHCFHKVISSPLSAVILSNCPSKQSTSHRIYSAISHLNVLSRAKEGCMFNTAPVKSSIHDNSCDKLLKSHLVYAILLFYALINCSLHDFLEKFCETRETKHRVFHTTEFHMKASGVLDVHNNHVRVHNAHLNHLTHCVSNLIRVLFLLKGYIILGNRIVACSSV